MSFLGGSLVQEYCGMLIGSGRDGSGFAAWWTIEDLSLLAVVARAVLRSLRRRTLAML